MCPVLKGSPLEQRQSQGVFRNAVSHPEENTMKNRIVNSQTIRARKSPISNGQEKD
jgi:hypothetical protein